MAKIDPRRLDEAERRYLNGQTTHKIETELAATYGITRRQVRNYLAIVRKRLAEAMKGTDPDEARARIEGMLLNAYAVAEVGSEKTGPNASAMVAAAARLAEIHGVLAPQRIEHSGSILNASPEQIHDRLAAIVARASGEPHATATRKANGQGTNGASGSN